MAIYAVERDLTGISTEDLAGAQAAATATAQEMSNDGSDITYLRSIFLPQEGRCLCLFSAQGAATVETLNTRASLPFSRVLDAMDLPPPTRD